MKGPHHPSQRRVTGTRVGTRTRGYTPGAMPMNNATQLTKAERQRIKEWF